MGPESLAHRVASGKAVVGGVLSGTSGDGIDVALCRLGGVEGGREPRVVEVAAHATRAFEPALGVVVRAVLDGETLPLNELALLHRDLGCAMGSAARALAREAGLPLDLLGCHGQTVWHHDGREPSGPATLQLGDGCFAAEAAACAVVSDLRQRDCAAGGEGAPLVALVDDLLFPDLPRPCALLNLGGMANLTILREGATPLAFDVGPCNALLDGLARRLLGRPFDAGGEAARSAAPDDALVARLGEHVFLDRAPPKSTGRDTFGEPWVDSVLGAAPGLPPGVVLASAACFVAGAVAGALERWAPALAAPVVLAGGGVHNASLCAFLGARLSAGVERADDHGIPADARESVAFAALAACHVMGVALSTPSATGAAPGRVLGKLSPAGPTP